jgi:IS30 family transposase
MTAFACEFNRSTQHFILWVKEGVLQMKYRTRTHYTDSQKALMWDRWQKGDSMKEIGRLFDRGHTTVQRILTENGGIRPPVRKRSPLALTLAEREVISRGLARQLSLRTIADQLDRSPSTVSREINRNGGHASYRANIAEDAAWKRTLRPKDCKLADRPFLVRLITRKM